MRRQPTPRPTGFADLEAVVVQLLCPHILSIGLTMHDTGEGRKRCVFGDLACELDCLVVQLVLRRQNLRQSDPMGLFFAEDT